MVWCNVLMCMALSAGGSRQSSHCTHRFFGLPSKDENLCKFIRRRHMCTACEGLPSLAGSTLSSRRSLLTPAAGVTNAS